MDQFSRIRLNIGDEKIQLLKNSRVAVFGIGGVGSYVVEALVRSGVGAIDIIDNDTVSLTNINRQLYALHSTVGKVKVDVAEERIRDINPECKVTKWQCFFTPENSSQFDFTKYSYVVDCIDTVAGKIEIIKLAKENNVPVISSMGAGNKFNPMLFKVADISKTSVCPLARVMRRELKNRNIKNVKVVFSTENAMEPLPQEEAALMQEEKVAKKQIPGSNAFVPSVAGLLIASEVIKDLCKISS